MIAATYVLNLIGPDGWEPEGGGSLSLGGSLLREVEENISDLLPEGWSITIREWDDDEGVEQDG